MFGHSLGENLCAYTDGCFTKYQCIMAAYYRGKASSEVHLRKGLMASVGAYAKLLFYINHYRSVLELTFSDILFVFKFDYRFELHEINECTAECGSRLSQLQR